MEKSNYAILFYAICGIYAFFCYKKAQQHLSDQGREKKGKLGMFSFPTPDDFTEEGWKYQVRAYIIIPIAFLLTIFFVLILKNVS